ncbi:MAG TPA: DUF5681 domain-containing protein [Terriglobales bacterium]|nr:DUF5681 domain-containing protein [Terriglobales bacterium]
MGFDPAQPAKIVMAQNRQKKEAKRPGNPYIQNVGKETRFKPGESGNPGGRPKNDWAREIARAVFENNVESIYEAMLSVLLKGSGNAFKELAERAYGKVVSKHEISGADGGPLNVSYSEMTTEELDAQIKTLMDELGLERKRVPGE